MKRHPYLPNFWALVVVMNSKNILLSSILLTACSQPSIKLSDCLYICKRVISNWVFFPSFFPPFSFLFSFRKQDNWQAVGYTQVKPSGTGHSKAFIYSPMGLNPKLLWYQTGVIPLSHHPWGNWVLDFICILLPRLQSFRVFRKEVARYKRKKGH